MYLYLLRMLANKTKIITLAVRIGNHITKYNVNNSTEGRARNVDYKNTTVQLGHLKMTLDGVAA